MTDERDSPSPPDFDLVGSWEASLADRSTKERVYDVATTLTDPESVATVAERADCSKGGARANLEWLAELGVVEKVADDPAMYRRNDAYFAFLRVDRLRREHDSEEIEARIEEYERREAELAEGFEADSPAGAEALLTVAFEELDTAYDRLSEWRTVRRRLRDLRRAHLLAGGGSSEDAERPTV